MKHPGDVEFKHMTRLSTLKKYCGPLYVVVTVTLGLIFVLKSNPYLESRTFWPSYRSLEIEKTLVRTFDAQLTVRSSIEHLDLLSTSHLLSPTDMLGINPAYPRLLMYQELTTLLSAVQGLHSLEANKVNFMITQYCWADFGRKWSMAHTSLRQTRCENYKPNAAVYLEAVLRNINFGAWIDSAPGQFEAYIGNPIAQTPGGKEWVAKLYAHEWLSVQDEVALWQTFDLVYFQLAYSNQYQIGIEEKISVENALGQASTVTIKSLPSTRRGALWTSSYLYLGFHYDFVAVEMNQSLVRNTPNFFGDIDETQIEAYDAGFPLPEFYQAVHDQIGPLGTIDLIYISPPNDLVAVVENFRAQVFAALIESSALQTAVNTFGMFVLFPTPKKWQNTNFKFHGGNMMCEFPTATTFVQNSFGFDDTCSGTSVLEVNMHLFSGWFALAMMGGKIGTPCELIPPLDQTQCLQAISQLQSFIPATLASLDTSLSSESKVMLSSLAIMQAVDNGTSITLDQQFLLEKSWAFLGWMKIYHWVLNQREVVSFQGDLSTMKLISYRYAPLSSQNLATFVTGWTQYLKLCIDASSGVMAAVGLLCLVLYFWHQCPQETHWFVFNRIVSTAWLNRGLMALRSVVAALCLGTSPVLPQTLSPGFTILSMQRRSWWFSGILAGETTWITYIMHELLHPVCSPSTHKFAPLSSFLAWFIVAVLDIADPIVIQASIKRDCYSMNMDEMVFCSSGSVAIGSYKRLLMIAGINVGSVLLCLLLAFRKQISSKSGIPNLLLPPALIDFYFQSQPELHRHLYIDKVTAAMCGVFSISWGDSGFIFDTKLWLTIRHSTLDFYTDAKSIALPQCLSRQMSMWNTAPRNAKPVEIWRRTFIALGFCYLGLSLAGNIAYLSVASINLDNDYGWAGYNITGMRAFLANTFNQNLLTSQKTSITLNEESQGDIVRMYNSTQTLIVWGENMARQQLYNPQNIVLEKVIQGLRNMDPCMLPWMFTQYCWLDFDQNWVMASTTARQKRCTKRKVNGALYLESGLRNIRNWNEFELCWGTSFDIGFESFLKTTDAGETWLKRTRELSITVDDEIKLWTAKGITTFTLQWQNFKTTGMSDAISIITALGLTYSLSLSQSPAFTHMNQQSSLKMYWSFASDLWAVASNLTKIGGHSLIRSSPKYAFANISSEDLLFENTTLILPLTPGFTTIRSVLGPFNSVDMLYVHIPESLLQLYAVFQASLTSLLLENATAQLIYASITPPSLMLGIPQEVINNKTARVVGGNILCGNDVPSSSTGGGMSTYFGTKNTCHCYFSDYIVPKLGEILFALLALNTQQSLSSTDISTICSCDSLELSSCSGIYESILHFGLNSNVTLSLNLIQNTQNDISLLNVQIVQFLTNSSSPVDMFLKQVVSATDRVYSFYGWCMLFEWATGLREVVTFEGDSGTVTAISTRNDPLSMSTLDDTMPQSLSYLFQCCAQYVTSVLIGVAALTIVTALIHRGNLEGLNLFELNRIVGHVWIGRTFLIVRSITAMWLLNTNTLELVQVGFVTRCISPPLAWYKNILAAGESTWFVYVLNDILSCITLQYTSYYATKSALLVWFIVAWWTLASPQQVYSAIDRTCNYINMDQALICSSGYVQIGSVSRLLGVVAICFGSITFCYILERLRQPHLSRLNIPTQLLNSQSYYLLDFTHWVHGNNYFLDSTSALMAGILTWHTPHYMYVLDVKSWRYFFVESNELDHMLSSNGQHDRMNGTIPLSCF